MTGIESEMAKVFISYRRSDATTGYASWIYDRLESVLIDEAPMPKSSALPEELRSLAFRNALTFQRRGGTAMRDVLMTVEQVAREQAQASMPSGTPSEDNPARDQALPRGDEPRWLKRAVGIETKGGVMTKLLDAHLPLPVSHSEVFSTAEDNQPSIEIHLLQGDQAMASDSRSLGKVQLDIPPARRGIPQIKVTFSIGKDGALSVRAQDLASGRQIGTRANFRDVEFAAA